MLVFWIVLGAVIGFWFSMFPASIGYSLLIGILASTLIYISLQLSKLVHLQKRQLFEQASQKYPEASKAEIAEKLEIPDRQIKNFLGKL
ncbi:hypothetical protein [Fictibacillus gelatini]|uniref:hypothetical protein n=1 Tax=Fictibacillus gelatini TaxID=225985 RepID=UPI000403096E|nr:hypothetical protein [Fictibacillus gelatini]